MKKGLKDELNALDLLNLELENIKDYLLQNKSYIKKIETEEKVSILSELKQENTLLKEQLSEYRNFLSLVLENIENIFNTIEELKNNE